MSKNIIIQEGGNAKSFSNTAKIQTTLMGGGSQDWIPEDEARDYAFANGEIYLGELDVEANGRYTASSDDLDGYSTVNVNLPLEKLEVSENGYYSAEDAGVAGFSAVDVALPSGQIPGGREVHGVASQNLALYQTVKVTTGAQNLTYVTNGQQSGWIRNDNRIYRLVNNHFNAYNAVTGVLEKTGTDFVYSVFYSSDNQIVALRLNDYTSYPLTMRFKILTVDGKEFIISINKVYAANDYTPGFSFGYNNGILAVWYAYDSARQYKTFNTYNTNGQLLAEKVGSFFVKFAVYLPVICPMSKNTIAFIYDDFGDYAGSHTYYSGTVTGDINTQPKLNSHSMTVVRNGSYVAGGPIGWYGGKFYLSMLPINGNSYYVFSVDIGDVTSDFTRCAFETPSDKAPGAINMYGHFQAYSNNKYRVFSVPTFADAYPDLLANDTAGTLIENGNYLLLVDTYLKGSADMIIPTSQYPSSHADGVLLGIMKADCAAGGDGTVIVLFD